MRRVLALLLSIMAAAPAAAEPRPGDRFSLSPADLPPPNATRSSAHPADVVRRPPEARLSVPEGWRATLFAEELDHPRNLLVLPDNSVLVAEQRSGKLTRLVDADGDGRADRRSSLARGLSGPFGLAYLDGAIWVADVERVWRLAWRPGQETAGEPQPVTEKGVLGGRWGHSTRSLTFAPDGKRFFVGIGSETNISVEKPPRATIQEFILDADGKAVRQRTFAAGLRNPVGMAIRPGTAELWAVVNERDGMGDELVPDFLTLVEDGAFYGWPYTYIGENPQPGFADKPDRPATKARVPDLLFRSHSAPLGLAFLDGDAYVGLHGSWNRSEPAGYFVARVPFADGRPAGGYEVFAAGFMVGDRKVWGRPVGIAAGPDGSLYVADDAGKTVWKVARER